MKKIDQFTKKPFDLVSLWKIVLAAMLFGGVAGAADNLSSEVLFHASFDSGFDADKAKGDSTGKVVGKVESADGIKGKAVVVGPKGWLEYQIEDNINKGGGAGSIEMWVKPLDWDGAQPKEATFFYADYENEGKSPDQVGLFRLYNLPGVARLTFIGGAYPKDTPDKWVTVQTEITDWKKGEWRHVVVTWDGCRLAIYVDGEQKYRAQIPIMNRGGEDPRFVPDLGKVFTVGGNPWGEAGETAIDEVTLYKSALLPEDVARRFKLRAGFKGPAVSPPAGTPEAKTNAAAEKSSGSGALTVPLDMRTRVSIAVPIIKTKPVIDGVVDEKEWAGASSANGFVEIIDTDYRLGRHDNRFHICVADQTLYLGLVSDFNGGVPPTAEAASNSGNVFMDDCFELHFSSPENTEQAYKYDVNAKGCLDHYHIRPKGKLESTNAQAAAKILTGKWSCELAVPLKELGRDRALSVGDKLLLQVARSYKEGSLAQRAEAARSVDQGITKEKYAGFPWNDLFLNVKNYAELTLVDDRHVVQSTVDLNAYFGKGELKVQGTLGPAWPSTVKSGQLRIDESARESATDRIALQPDGSYALTKTLPDQTGEAVISFAGALCVKLPLCKSAAALRLNHTIFSHNNTLQVELDLSELAAIKPAEVGGEVLIKDGQNKVVGGEKIGSFAKVVEKRTLSIAALAAGKHTIECSLKDRSGKAVANASQSFEVFRKLPGEGNRLGITDQAPAPWTPVEVGKGNQVKVWGRTYDFGTSILPQQVVILGKPILSAPIAYEIQLAGAPSSRVHNGNLKTVEQTPGKVVLEGIYRGTDVQIKQTVTVEFDGMIRCDAEVTAKKPIQQLALKIPYQKERAKWFYAVAARGKFIDQIHNVPEINSSFKWSCGYLYPCMWITDMQGGLSWFAGSDRTWVVDRKRDKLVATQEGMTVNFVDTESTDTKSIKFTYGLQAFPTKPPRPDWREFGRVREAKWMSVFTPNAHYEKTDGRVPEDFYRELMRDKSKLSERALLLPFGDFPRSVEDYADLSPDVYDFSVKLLQQKLSEFRGRGCEFIIPYLTPTYASYGIPEWKFYWSNWLAIPKASFEEYGQPAACVANPQWKEFWLQSFHDYVKKHQLKGVFHDMALPYAEEGKLNGLGYDKDGVRYPEYPIWELREIFKRIYIIHRELFPDAMSFMNMGGNFVPPIHSFTDFLLTCERFETKAVRTIYDLDGDGNISLFTAQTSLPAGPKGIVNDWVYLPFAMNEKEPTIHLYGLVLLHDLVQWNINENPEIRTGAHALKKRFGIGYDREVEFLPYWENGDKYRVDSKDIVISFYRKGSKLLAIIVSKSMKNTFQGTVELSTKSLGIDSVQTVEVYDPLACTYESVKDKGVDGKIQLKMEIKPTLYKAVLVNVP